MFAYKSHIITTMYPIVHFYNYLTKIMNARLIDIMYIKCIF